MIECECCGAMTPTRSKHGNKYYEYYTPLKTVKEGAKIAYCKIGSIPAGEIEAFVIDKIKNVFQAPELQQSLLKEFEKQRLNYNAADVHKIISDIGDAFKYFEPGTVRDFISEIVKKSLFATNILKLN